MNVCDGLRRVSRVIAGLEITAGIVFVVLVSCVVSGVAAYLRTAELSLNHSVFHRGHVHRLLTYSFYHADVEQLVLGVALLAVFCGALERGVGTVRFLHLFLVLSCSVGVLHTLLGPLLPGAPGGPVSGLVPVSLAMLGAGTIGSRMRKAYLMGLSVPTATLPWILMLAVALLVPGAGLLCNVLAVVIGQMYGVGWLRLLELSEWRACLLEKKPPFRWMRRAPGARFVPASAEARRKILHTTCSPPPGSYPVQVYTPSTPGAGTTPSTQDGWPHSPHLQLGHAVPTLVSHTGLKPRFESGGHGHSHGCGHGHSHGHQHHAGGSPMPAGPPGAHPGLGTFGLLHAGTPDPPGNPGTN